MRDGFWVVVLAATGSLLSSCGRLGFDPGTDVGEPGLDANVNGSGPDGAPAALAMTLAVVAGVTSLDAEVCITRPAMVRTVVTTGTLAPGWTAADLEAYVAAAPAELLSASAPSAAPAGCTTYGHAVTGEATACNVYATSEAAATSEEQRAEAAAVLAATVELVSFDAGGGRTANYYVSRPERYYRDPSQPLPVLIFLHGSGEDGDDSGANIGLLLTRSTLVRELIDRTPALTNHPFLVIAPQCNTAIGSCWGWAGQMAMLDAVVASVSTSATLDLDRFYVTGLSTGGEGTWNYAEHNPDVDAIVPMASTYAGDASWMPRICNLSGVSVWTFHNSDDPTQPASNSQRLVQLLDGCGPADAPQLDIPNATSHNVWTSVYTNVHGFSNDGTTSIYDWLMMH